LEHLERLMKAGLPACVLVSISWAQISHVAYPLTLIRAYSAVLPCAWL